MIDNYLTGNIGLDNKIKAALEKEKKQKDILVAGDVSKVWVTQPFYEFIITPMGKPRMTQRDKWPKTRSKQANRYFTYKDLIRQMASDDEFIASSNMKIMFYLPFPKSYNKRQRERLALQPHQLKPDIDNLVKGFLDAVIENDATVWHVDAMKYWSNGDEGKILVQHL